MYKWKKAIVCPILLFHWRSSVSISSYKSILLSQMFPPSHKNSKSEVLMSLEGTVLTLNSAIYCLKTSPQFKFCMASLVNFFCSLDTERILESHFHNLMHRVPQFSWWISSLNLFFNWYMNKTIKILHINGILWDVLICAYIE
jgi:hypothetical protein